MRPVDGVTLDEAAHIVGCSGRTLLRHIAAGRLPAGPKHERRRVSRADAEAVALQLPSSRVPFNTETSYWVGATAAAGLLGVGVARLNQLVAAGRVPYEVHADGRRMYRREQLLTVANARQARSRPRLLTWTNSGARSGEAKKSSVTVNVAATEAAPAVAPDAIDQLRSWPICTPLASSLTMSSPRRRPTC